MKDVEFFLWLVPDRVTGKPRKTRHRMTVDQAPRGAVRLDWSREVRRLPENSAEFDVSSHPVCYGLTREQLADARALAQAEQLLRDMARASC